MFPIFFPITPHENQTVHFMTPKVPPFTLVPNALQLCYVLFPSSFKTPPPLPDLLSLTMTGDPSHENWGSSRTNHWSPSYPHFQMQSDMGHHKKCSCHRTSPPPIIVSVTQRQETKNICEEVGIIFLKTWKSFYN